MRNLMHANFIRYISRLSTLIAFMISLTLGLVTAFDSSKESYVNGIKNEYFSPELQYLLFVFFLAVIVSVVNIGSEFAAGTIRNKLVSGYTKMEIFFSELILSLVFSVILFILYYLPFLVKGWKYLGNLDYILEVTALLLLSILSLTVFAVFLCFLTENRIIAVVIGIMVVVVMLMSADAVAKRLKEPQYNQETIYGDGSSMLVTGNGVIRTFSDNAGTDDVGVKEIRDIPNPKYVDGIFRKVLSFALEINCFQRIKDSIEFFNRQNMLKYGESGLPDDIAKDIALEYEKLNEETVDKIRLEMIYNVLLIVAFASVGVLIFRKKNIR